MNSRENGRKMSRVIHMAMFYKQHSTPLPESPTTNGKSLCRRPKWRWQDTINVDMKITQLESVAMFDHVTWCLLIRKADPAPVERTLGRRQRSCLTAAKQNTGNASVWIRKWEPYISGNVCPVYWCISPLKTLRITHYAMPKEACGRQELLNSCLSLKIPLKPEFCYNLGYDMIKL